MKNLRSSRYEYYKALVHVCKSLVGLLKQEKDALDDLATELELADEDESVLYAFSDLFDLLSTDST